MKIVEDAQVPKVWNEFTVDDLTTLRKNVKAKNILMCGLGPDEYNRISNSSTTKQIWHALVNAHEGTNQVRNFKVSETNGIDGFSFRHLKLQMVQRIFFYNLGF